MFSTWAIGPASAQRSGILKTAWARAVTGESDDNLRELGEEVGRVRADLAEGECDEHGGEEVGDGEVEERVLWQPAAPLQHGEDHRPRAQEHQRHAHQADGAADVLHQVHLPSL
jgi:hypothetical protein